MLMLAPGLGTLPAFFSFTALDLTVSASPVPSLQTFTAPALVGGQMRNRGGCHSLGLDKYGTCTISVPCAESYGSYSTPTPHTHTVPSYEYRYCTVGLHCSTGRPPVATTLRYRTAVMSCTAFFGSRRRRVDVVLTLWITSSVNRHKAATQM